ncbi:hypothetical protein NUW58_g7618 [Xylaria curta]|uniref:Uncharacterized protein n=1 Tax=Xylaria curta TaxID=42375 RepID=A0ACC1NFJ3_9PEZI|nr:hypothetical protein NUW58_g7618 [Xylaria curta]
MPSDLENSASINNTMPSNVEDVPIMATVPCNVEDDTNVMPKLEDRYDAEVPSLPYLGTLCGLLTDSWPNSYAPNWAPYFEQNGKRKSGVEIAVDCAICRQSLAITQCADYQHESFTVLPCGHVFGFECIEQWFREAGNCPTCRKRLVTEFFYSFFPCYALATPVGFQCSRHLLTLVNITDSCAVNSTQHMGCGHYVEVDRMCGGSGFNIHKILKSIPPHGENLPMDCKWCEGCRRNGMVPGPGPYGPIPQPDVYDLSQRNLSTLTPQGRNHMPGYLPRMSETWPWPEPFANRNGHMPNLIQNNGRAWDFVRGEPVHVVRDYTNGYLSETWYWPEHFANRNGQMPNLTRNNGRAWEFARGEPVQMDMVRRERAAQRWRRQRESNFRRSA